MFSTKVKFQEIKHFYKQHKQELKGKQYNMITNAAEASFASRVNYLDKLINRLYDKFGNDAVESVLEKLDEKRGQRWAAEQKTNE